MSSVQDSGKNVKGPESGITGLQGSNSLFSAGGEDTLEFSLSVCWSDWLVFRNRLECGRQAASLVGGKSLTLLADPDFFVPMSAGGRGNGKNYFRYLFELGGISVAIQDKSDGRVAFRVGSLLCMSWGYAGVLSHCRAMVAALGGVETSSMLSRVDLAVDLTGVSMREITNAFQSGCVVCRGDDVAIYSRACSPTGIVFGGGSTVVRIYDKALETRRRGDKWAWLVEHRYGGVEPEYAVRVEIQLRRDTLRELGVDSLEDYELKRAAIARYITFEWVRFTDGPVDRQGKNQAHTKHSLFWSRVVSAYESVTGFTDVSIRRVRRTGARVESLIKQAVGCLASAQVLDVGYVSASASDLLSQGFGAVSAALRRWGPDYLDQLADRAILRLLCVSPDSPVNTSGRFFGNIDYSFTQRDGAYCLLGPFCPS